MMPRLRVWIAGAGLVLAAHAVLVARVDVKVEHDKKFDFKPMHTWAWNADGPGEVKMARTPTDDPETMRQQAEPVIVEAVTAELQKRGLQTTAGEPDLFVRYYLLLTTSINAQTMGQFIPSVPEWGLPPFPPATQALNVMNQGSLVIDLKAKQTIVWRGVAQAKVQIGAEPKKREAVLREAVRDLIRRYPPR